MALHAKHGAVVAGREEGASPLAGGRARVERPDARVARRLGIDEAARLA